MFLINEWEDGKEAVWPGLVSVKEAQSLWVLTPNEVTHSGTETLTGLEEENVQTQI